MEPTPLLLSIIIRLLLLRRVGDAYAIRASSDLCVGNGIGLSRDRSGLPYLIMACGRCSSSELAAAAVV